MGLPGFSSVCCTSLLEALLQHLLQGTSPTQGLEQKQSQAKTPDCISGTQHPRV